MTLNWDVMNTAGNKVHEVTLPAEIFNVDMNTALLHAVIKAYQANRRQGTHATKTRSLVSGTGKKPFRQKGTGSARQGSLRGPHMYHGAVAHGPQPRNYRQHINKRMKQQAARIALSDKARHQKLVILDQIQLDKYSTKTIKTMLGTLIPSFKALLVDHREDDFVYKSVRNLHGTHYLVDNLVNSENILKSEYLILTQAAFNNLCSRLNHGGHS